MLPACGYSQALPKAILHDIKNSPSAGAPEEIRTPDPQIRSLVLYPAELRARLAHFAREVFPSRVNPPGTRV
jgi:hypothetical protein